MIKFKVKGLATAVVSINPVKLKFDKKSANH